MQAVVAIPEITSLVCHKKASELILRQVAGVPLLMRTLITAARAGADHILLICPAALGKELVGQFLETALQYGVRVWVIQLDAFDPGAESSWAKLAPHVNHDFLWLPWNWVTTKQFLTHLPLAQIHSINWAEPAHATAYEVTRDTASSALLHPEGVAVTSPETVSLAERFLVVHSGIVQPTTLSPFRENSVSHIRYSECCHLGWSRDFHSGGGRVCPGIVRVVGARSVALLPGGTI
jgi:hypothetical protein